MKTTVNRKCPKCHTWNTDNDYCTNCNELLNHQIRLKEAEQARQTEWDNRKLDKIDATIKRMQYSKYAVVRILFYFVYSVWMIIFWISSFFITMIAMGPG